MIQPTPENVEQFRQLVDLAQTGELQSAVAKRGPFEVNPYYYDNPGLVSVVGFFMNTLVPVIQETSGLGDEAVSIRQIYMRHMNEHDGASAGVSVTTSARWLADSGGYIYKATRIDDDDPDPVLPLYKPTKAILDIVPREVFVGKHTNPEAKGCLGGVAIGIGAGVTVATITGRPLNGLWAGLLTSAGGMEFGEWQGKVQAGREALKHYRDQSELN